MAKQGVNRNDSQVSSLKVCGWKMVEVPLAEDTLIIHKFSIARNFISRKIDAMGLVQGSQPSEPCRKLTHTTTAICASTKLLLQILGDVPSVLPQESTGVPIDAHVVWRKDDSPSRFAWIMVERMRGTILVERDHEPASRNCC